MAKACRSDTGFEHLRLERFVSKLHHHVRRLDATAAPLSKKKLHVAESDDTGSPNPR